MTTTTLLVELVIIGMQALIWLILLVLTITKNANVFLGILKENPSLSLLVAITVAYSIGVMFDYIIPWVFKKLRFEKQSNLFDPNRKENVIDILNKMPEVHKYLDSHYSRIRIARATLFNTPLITVFSILFMLTSDFKRAIYISLLTFLIGVILTLAARLAFFERSKTYYNYLLRAFELIGNKK